MATTMNWGVLKLGSSPRGMLKRELSPMAITITKMMMVNCQFLTENSAIFMRGRV
jgi:hypothetical protein